VQHHIFVGRQPTQSSEPNAIVQAVEMSNWRIPQLFVGRGPLGAVTRCVLLLAATLGLAATSGNARNARNASAELLAFGGRIIAADRGSLEGVHVVAVDARGTYEALVDSSGVFVGAFAAAPVGRVTLRVFSDSTAPRYHTSVITLGAGVPAMPARIVLVPRSWRIRGGVFDGREVRTDPVRATTRYADGMGYWRLTRRGYLAGRAVSWSTDSLPVRVAFRHERGDLYISADDSVRFWEKAREVERLIGRSLFRPASYEDVEAGGDGIFVTVDRRMSSAGKTFITYDQSGRIYEALVTVAQRDYLGQSRIASHELLHAIGLGHTGAWPSVMGANTGAIESPSVEDVAYAQLYYAISQLQREREAPFGILESGR